MYCQLRREMAIKVCGMKIKLMKRRRVEKGDFYGYWEVLEKDHHVEGANFPFALCCCLLCGKQYPVNKYNLQSRVTTKCRRCAELNLSESGLEARKLYLKQRGEEEVGRVYGSWKVLKAPSYVGANGSQTTCKTVLCRCTCKKTSYLRLHNLKKGECSKQCNHKKRWEK